MELRLHDTAEYCSLYVRTNILYLCSVHTHVLRVHKTYLVVSTKNSLFQISLHRFLWIFIETIQPKHGKWGASHKSIENKATWTEWNELFS